MTEKQYIQYEAITATCAPSNVLLQQRLRNMYIQSQHNIKSYQRKKPPITIQQIAKPKQIILSTDNVSCNDTAKCDVKNDLVIKRLRLRDSTDDPFQQFHNKYKHKHDQLYRINNKSVPVVSADDSVPDIDKLSKQLFSSTPRRPFRINQSISTAACNIPHNTHINTQSVPQQQLNQLVDQQIDCWLLTHKLFQQPTLSDSTRLKAHELFSMLDRDNSDSIDVSELKHAMIELGIHNSDDEIRCRIHDIDRDGSGEISFNEFVIGYDALINWNDINHLVNYRLQHRKLQLTNDNQSIELPLTLIIPAYHRLTIINSVIENKNSFDKTIQSKGIQSMNHIMYSNDSMISATKSNHYTTVLQLIQSSGTTRHQQIQYVNRVDRSGCTALIHSAIHNSIDVAKILLHHGASVHCANNRLNTALHIAAQQHNRLLVQLLIQHNASVQCKNWNNLTPSDCCDVNKKTSDEIHAMRQYIQLCYTEYLNNESIDSQGTDSNVNETTESTIDPAQLFDYTDYDESQLCINSQLFPSTVYNMSHKHQSTNTRQSMTPHQITQVKQALVQQLNQHSLSELFHKTINTITDKQSNPQKHN